MCCVCLYVSPYVHMCVHARNYCACVVCMWGLVCDVRNALYCIVLHCIALHCIALHCIALHHITYVAFLQLDSSSAVFDPPSDLGKLQCIDDTKWYLVKGNC